MCALPSPGPFTLFIASSGRPTRPETPKLLPAIAEAWPPMCAALRDCRTAVVETSLGLVSETARLAGGLFMARRFRSEAFPVVCRLLASGTAYSPAMSPSTLLLQPPGSSAAGSRQQLLQPSTRGAAEEALAPAAVQRVCLVASQVVTDSAVRTSCETWLPGLEQRNKLSLARIRNSGIAAVMRKNEK